MSPLLPLPSWRTLFLTAGAVASISVPASAVAAAPGSEAGTSADATGTAGAGQTWADYFYPLKVGWTCHESVDSGGITGSETLTVASIGSVPTGRSVTVDTASSTTVNGTTVPTNAALRYILTSKGGLVTVPSSGQLAGQAYRIEGNTTYPSVRALLSGNSSTSSLHITAPLSASDRTELKAVLPANATGLDMAVTIRQSGTMIPTLRTPAGTFHNALAVRSGLKSISITNALKSESKELNSVLKPIVAKELASTTWYARGAGPVKIFLDGITGYITGCGLSSSPTGGAGTGNTGNTGTTGSAGNSGGTTA